MLKTSELEHIRVRDCMNPGIISCAADAPLAEVAAMMAKFRVHAIAVTKGERGGRPIGFVSDLDVVAAATSGTEPTAIQVAGTKPLTVSSDATVHQAARVMAEHGTAHLIVLGAESGYPIGILSTLDVAAVLAGESVDA